MSEDDKEERGFYVLGADDNYEDTFRGGPGSQSMRKWVSTEVVRQNLQELLENLGATLEQAHEATLGKFELDEIKITLEMTASGKVSLLGLGGDVGSKGGISMTLRRKSPAAPSD